MMKIATTLHFLGAKWSLCWIYHPVKFSRLKLCSLHSWNSLQTPCRLKPPLPSTGIRGARANRQNISHSSSDSELCSSNSALTLFSLESSFWWSSPLLFSCADSCLEPCHSQTCAWSLDLDFRLLLLLTLNEQQIRCISEWILLLGFPVIPALWFVIASILAAESICRPLHRALVPSVATLWLQTGPHLGPRHCYWSAWHFS